MIDYRVKGRPLLCFSTRGSTGLEASSKGIKEMHECKTPLAEQRG